MNTPIFKIVIILLITISGVLSAHSQEAVRDSFNYKRTEINIAVADIFAKSRPLNYYYINSSFVNLPYRINSYEYIPNTNLQLGAKFHTLTGAVRLSCGFSYSNYSSSDKTINNIEITFNGSNVRFATGYEWHYTYSRVNIYFGADFSFALSNYNFKFIDRTTEINNKANVTYLGINPLLGLNYFITPQLSVGTEIRFTAEMYTGNESVDNMINNESYEYDFNGLRTYLGPLGFISFNIHF